MKKSGRIGSILKYIDWDKIVPLGAARAACALQRKRDPDNLQSKEVTPLYFICAIFVLYLCYNIIQELFPRKVMETGDR